MNRLWRIALNAAYSLACCYWFVVRPTTRGAYVAVWCDGRVLIIRNSYRRKYSIPAGGVKSSESFIEAGVRELSEEVGIAIIESDLTLYSAYESREEFKRDLTELFEIHLDDEPNVAVDGREVIEARFMRPDEALELPLVDVVRRYLSTRPHVA